MKQYIAAIDQGTTSTRCILFDHAGRIVGSAQQEHRQIFPRPGWVEHDAEEIWLATRDVSERALTAAGATAAEVAAVGITNQRETVLAWDRGTGRPLHNALVWQDTRTDEICKGLAGTAGPDRFRAKTGLPISTYFSGPKLTWLFENVPGLRQRAESGEVLVGTIDTWIIWRLTGRHYTDVTNASRTLLMDIGALRWDESLLDAMGVPKEALAQIGPSSRHIGEIQADSALRGIEVTGDLGDQQAALFGQTCFAPGDAKNTYGTGCFLLMNTGETAIRSTAGLLTTLAYQIGEAKPAYALEGSVAIAGGLVQWLRDNLGIIARSTEVEALAKTVKDNGGVYFVPAFSGLFAPHWRSDARGVIVGLTRFSNKGHVARAALEATAFQTLEVLEAMERDSRVKLHMLRVDGGMVANELLMQFQADLLGVPVVRPAVAETTALGAAYAAGLAAGYWKGFDDLRQNWRKETEWKPKGEPTERNRLYAAWKRAVDRTLNWVE